VTNINIKWQGRCSTTSVETLIEDSWLHTQITMQVVVVHKMGAGDCPPETWHRLPGTDKLVPEIADAQKVFSAFHAHYWKALDASFSEPVLKVKSDMSS
jgi:hypothetical protein